VVQLIDSVKNNQLKVYCEYLVGAIFKILPLMEEGSGDWVKHTRSLVLELKGINATYENIYLIRLLGKLEGLITLQTIDNKNDQAAHAFFKKTVFDSIELAGKAAVGGGLNG
jgi:hypothetical protein